MMSRTTQSRHRTVALLSVCLAVLLSIPVLEAGHLHNGALELSDCVQCQVQGAAAIVASDAVPAFCSGQSRVDWLSPHADPASTHYRLPARGPPNFSS